MKAKTVNGRYGQYILVKYTGEKVAPAAPGPVVVGLLLLWSEKTH
jgi:hypothetical protein